MPRKSKADFDRGLKENKYDSTYFDPRVWLRGSEKSESARVKVAIVEFDCVRQLKRIWKSNEMCT